MNDTGSGSGSSFTSDVPALLRTSTSISSIIQIEPDGRGGMSSQYVSGSDAVHTFSRCGRMLRRLRTYAETTV